MCALYLCSQKFVDHLLATCNYTEAVWSQVANMLNLLAYFQLRLTGGPAQWAETLISTGTKKIYRRRKLGILFYFWWAIWKESNTRIFDNRDRSPNQLISLLKDEITLHLSVLGC
jgi:hypothetical protein